jgi:hypothetical protein
MRGISQHYDEELTQAALDALHLSTGVQGRLVPIPGKMPRNTPEPDAAIELAIDGKRHSFLVECKSVADRFAVLAQVKHQTDLYKKPGLLVSPHLTAKMAEHCRAIGLNFIDTAGNAYLSASGLYVFVNAQKTPAIATQANNRSSANSSSLRMIFTLLTRPELIRASYREIANAAGIALGAVGPIFQDLENRGLISSTDKEQGRQLLEPARLVDEWTANYPIKLRPKLHERRFQAADFDWWKNVNPAKFHAWWGGEVAADRMTGILKPATQTLYIAPTEMRSSLQALVTKYRLRADPQGPIEIRDAFWNLPRDGAQLDLAPPLLVYADLMASLDSRNLAVAKTIREQVMHHA